MFYKNINLIVIHIIVMQISITQSFILESQFDEMFYGLHSTHNYLTSASPDFQVSVKSTNYI